MADQDDNVVHLRGRVGAVGEERQLPSGDVVLTMRMVVDRPAPSRGRARGSARVRVDTIDVACWSASTRKVVAGLGAQDHVEVDGALRRRFYRAGGVTTSRYEVEAARVRRVRRGAGVRAAAAEP